MVPMIAASAPVTLRNGAQPPLLDCTVPQVGLPASWYCAALADANSVAPGATSSVSPCRTVSGPDRNAVSPPEVASSTAFPLPPQPFSADWTRAVSGGDAS